MIGLFAMLALLAVGSARGPLQEEKELADPKLRISWTQFKPLYDKERVQVVDVREEDAFALGHIPGARSIPLEQVERRADELKKLERPIVLYCA